MRSAPRSLTPRPRGARRARGAARGAARAADTELRLVQPRQDAERHCARGGGATKHVYARLAVSCGADLPRLITPDITTLTCEV